MFFNVPILFATPTGSKVVAGSAGVGQTGNTTTVTMGSGRAVINWDSLNTSSNEILQFIKDSGGFAVLNRVVQGGATQFDGSLFGNQGHIIVVNPSGIVFGPTAFVEAYKFTASGLDISNTDFMNGHYQFVGGDGIGMVSNYGEISAEQVALIGKKVLNAGTITSPGGYVVMAAGDSIFLGEEGSDVVVEVAGVTVPQEPPMEGMGDVINEGTVEAAGGKIVLAAGDTFSRAIEGLDNLSIAVEGGTGRVGQFGTLNTDGGEGDGGSITLTAGDVVALSSDSITTANAGTNGDGGEVIAYSPKTAIFRDGAIVEAKGGSESGDGGFFELSGTEDVEIEGQIDLTAANGENGEFLIDPRNVKIVSGSSNQGDWDGSEWDPKWRLGYARLGIETLEGYLAGQDVTITTDGFSIFQSGWVKFDAGRDVENTTDNSLTVDADNYIKFYPDSGIDFTGGGDVTLNAGSSIFIDAEIDLYSGTFAAYSGLADESGFWFWYDPGIGNILVNADIEAGNIILSAGAGLPGYSDSHVIVDDGITLTANKRTVSQGDITVEAHHDVTLGGAVEADGDLIINADRHPEAGGEDHIYGGDVLAKGTLDAGGKIDMYGNNITLWDDVTSKYDMTITADTSSDFADPLPEGDVTAHGNLESTKGSIDIYADDDTIYLKNDYVKAHDDVTLHNNTVADDGVLIKAGDDIHVGGDDSISVDHPELYSDVSLTGLGDLELKSGQSGLGYGNIMIGGDVETAGDLTMTAGKDGGWNQSNIKIVGKVTTTATAGTIGNGDLYAKAGDDIELYDDVQSAGKMTLIALDDVQTFNGAKLTTTNVCNGDMYIEAGDDDLILSDGRPYRHVELTGEVESAGKLTISADDHINLGADVQSKGDMKLIADDGDGVGPYGAGWGDVTAYGNLKSTKGSIDIYAADDTIYLKNDYVKADDDITLHNNTVADDGVLIKAGDNVETYGTLTGKGDLTVKAGDDIQFGDDSGDYVTVEDTLIAKSGLDWFWFIPSWSEGSILVNADIEAGDILLSAGAGLPGYSDSHVTVADGITLSANRKTVGPWWCKQVISEGDITIEAHHDVTLGGAVKADGDLIINADRHDNWPYWTPDHMFGGDVLAKDTLDAGGTIDMYGNNITLMGDVTSKYDMTITADTSSDIVDPLPEGDVTAYGNLESRRGSIDIYAADDTIYLKNDYVKADDDITLHNNTVADDGVLIKAGDNVETYGTLTGKGDLTVKAGDDILFGDDSGDYVTVEDTLIAKSGLDWFWFIPSWSEGYIEAKGSVTAGDMLLSAGAGLPGYSDSHVFVDGMLTTTKGDMIVEAHHDITLGSDVDSAGNLVLNADRHSNWPFWTPDHMFGGDVEVKGTVNAGGAIDMYGNNITLEKEVTSKYDMTLIADTSSDIVDPLPEGDVRAYGDLTSTDGSVKIYSDDDTTYLGGDVKAFVDVLLNNNTRFIGHGDQHVTAETGTLTANGWLDKSPSFNCVGPTGGSLYLQADGDISLADYVTAGCYSGGFIGVDLTTNIRTEIGYGGGVSIISDNGKIFTPDEFGGETDTLNVAITGSSNYQWGIGVDLPKDYDVPSGHSGKAAIVIMSEEDLKLGPDAELTACGIYDTTGAVDDRPGVDFLDHPEGDKNPGWPIDVAIYLASNGGDVFVGSPVNPIPLGGVMVADAYDTVNFGAAFMDSLMAGNVGWLEVCSRRTPTQNHADIWGTLPFAADPGAKPWSGKYVLRGEHPDVGTGAWVLASGGVAPFGEGASLGTEEQTLGMEGCPLLTAAAADELGIAEDELNVFMANAMAAATDIQPCESCARLIDAATILRDEDGSKMAAMVQVFNELAPANAPFTPEMATSIVTAFAGHVDDGTQYATAIEYIDAFVQYIAVLDTEMGSPVAEGDSVAFVMGKHGTGITESDNANIGAFVATRLASLDTFGD
jgi:filamentous hemagglutinin family protein